MSHVMEGLSLAVAVVRVLLDIVKLLRERMPPPRKKTARYAAR